jgi:hypothetical protein
MALFGKKLSLEEILKAIEGLSDEEKAQVKAKMEEKPVEEPIEEGQEVVEKQVDNQETTEETEQTEEVAQEVEEPVEEPTENVETPNEEPTEEQPEIPAETEELNPIEEGNKDEVIQGLTERLTALEEKLAQFDELKGLMEEFTKKQADSFGYKGAIPGAKKDIHEMSASELKEKMLNGEI